MIRALAYSKHDGDSWAVLLPKLRSASIEPFTTDALVKDGRYQVTFWTHDTATQVRITALLPAGDSLLVYREDDWQGDYEHHNRDTIQGYQLDGPWVDELEAYRQELITSLAEHHASRARAEAEEKAKDAAQEAAKIRRFREAFTLART